MTSTTNEIKPVEVGDIFEASWGWDQTNVDFYKVVSLTKSGKSANIVKIGAKTVPGSEGFMCNRVVPDPDTVICDGCHGGEDDYRHHDTDSQRFHAYQPSESRHRILNSGRGPSLKVQSWGVWASRWERSDEDGTYQSWYA